MVRNGPSHQLHTTVWSWDAPSHMLPVSSPSPPCILQMKASSDIPVQISPDWQVVVLDFATLYISTTLMKIPMRKLIFPWSHYRSLDPILPSSAWKMLIYCPTTIPSPSWVVDSSSTVSDIQWRTTLYTSTLNIVVESIPPVPYLWSLITGVH